MDYDQFVFRPERNMRLADFAPDSTGEFASEEEARERVREDAALLARYQDILTAHEENGLLVILQGMDGSGKDEAIQHVLASVNPQECEVTAFKTPTDEETRRGYLWRAMKTVPARGRIGVFNRSYYEQVVTERVHPERLDRGETAAGGQRDRLWEARYRQINDFERYLAENNIPVLKLFLHVSKEEQRRRLLERIARPEKQWMFDKSDVEERAHWDAYMAAYERALERTSTEWAPWHVIPGDQRWFGRAAVASLVLAKLQSLHADYPAPDEDQQKELGEAREALENEAPRL